MAEHPVLGTLDLLAARRRAGLMGARVGPRAGRGGFRRPIAITLGSITQVALFVAPVLVALGVVCGQPMNLVFTNFEVVALGLASLIVTVIALDGESHWFEGVQLLAVYALLGIAVWFI